MATDFRDGKTFPRRGREALGDVLWLARVIDKGRAAAGGTIHDYIYPCPMDRAMFERWGITESQFGAALREHAGDDALVAWLKERVPPAKLTAANHWLRKHRSANLDAQDREEGVS